MDESLAGKVAIVTGASSGLGERFARVLHAAGAIVVVAARREDRLQQLCEMLGERSAAVQCDVGKDEDRRRLVDTTIERFGTVDVLVNNAGAGEPMPAEEESVEEFRSSLETNLVAVYHLSQLAGRQMLHQGSGSIVNVASMFGLVAASPIKHASYCASKGAVVALTRQLGCEWGARGVRVNAIAPGWFDTEMTRDMWDDPRSIDYVKRNTPLARPGRHDELDHILLLLAGSGGSFITGHTIPVDGGWTAR